MTQHYFTEKPKSVFKKEIFQVNIKDLMITINSGSGLFSIKDLDFGSKLLIENAKISAKATVLDLGCGYGIIGIAIKKIYPDSDVWMCDVNERAVKLAKENCTVNNVQCTVLKSNIFSNPLFRDKSFDIILSNPPFSAGKKICFQFIEQSFHHINKNGSLQIVAPHNKGGESLKKKMLEVFGNAGELTKKSGYRIYISKK